MWCARSPAASEVRRHLQRREPPGVTPAFDPEVFRARFLALKRADRLDDAKRPVWKPSSPPVPSSPERADAVGALRPLPSRRSHRCRTALGPVRSHMGGQPAARVLPGGLRPAPLGAGDLQFPSCRWPPVQRRARGHQQTPRPPEADGVRVRQRRQLRKPEASSSPKVPPHEIAQSQHSSVVLRAKHHGRILRAVRTFKCTASAPTSLRLHERDARMRGTVLLESRPPAVRGSYRQRHHRRCTGRSARPSSGTDDLHAAVPCAFSRRQSPEPCPNARSPHE
jgi:hypothetical protein